MNDTAIIIPSKKEDPRHVRRIKRNARCEVIVVYDKLYGEAIKEGIKLTKAKYILTMDADGQHTIEEAEKLYSAFKLAQCDLMIGDRRVKERNPIRFIASTVLNIFASSFAFRWVVDLNSGLRIFKRQHALDLESILCDDFSFTTSLAMGHLADDLKVEWFPINVQKRKEGKSHVKWRHGLITIYYIVRIGFALRTRRLREWIRSFR